MNRTIPLLNLVLSLCWGLSTLAQPNLTSTDVQIKGLVEKPFVLTLASVKSRQVVEGSNFKVTNHNGEVKRTIAQYKAVKLKDLLDEAKITLANPKERGKYYVVVTASDGYQTLFSYNELYSNPTGDTVLLLYEENGQEIKQDGKFLLICTADTITGPRHVKWVKTIEVAKINP